MTRIYKTLVKSHNYPPLYVFEEYQIEDYIGAPFSPAGGNYYSWHISHLLYYLLWSLNDPPEHIINTLTAFFSSHDEWTLYVNSDQIYSPHNDNATVILLLLAIGPWNFATYKGKHIDDWLIKAVAYA